MKNRALFTFFCLSIFTIANTKDIKGPPTPRNISLKHKSDAQCQSSDDNNYDDSDKEQKIIKEKWQDKPITAAVGTDIAMHAAVGAGLGHVAEKALYHALSKNRKIKTMEESEINSLTEAVTKGMSDAAIAAIAKAAPIALPGLAKSLTAASAKAGALAAKASAAAGSVATAPVAAGAGACLGAALLGYYAWYKWKTNQNEEEE